MSNHYDKKHINTNTEIISVCRSFLGNELKARHYKIQGLYQCRYGSTCKEAHRWDQLRMKKHIRDWYSKTDKSDVDLLALHDNIIEVITLNSDSIKNPKYKSAVPTIQRISFVELLSFTYDLICYHRKIKKVLPSRRTQGSEVPDIGEGGYRYKEDVPQFELKDEDLFWSLERSLHPCETHMRMMANKDITYQATELCCGDINCKFGEHDASKVACTEDMIKGTCTCLTTQQILDEKTRIGTELRSAEKQIEDSIDSDGFQIKISKKVREEISWKTSELKRAFSLLAVRKIHYTEQGMIPLLKRIADRDATKVTEIDITRIEITTPVKKVLKKTYGQTN